MPVPLAFESSSSIGRACGVSYRQPRRLGNVPRAERPSPTRIPRLLARPCRRRSRRTGRTRETERSSLGAVELQRPGSLVAGPGLSVTWSVEPGHAVVTSSLSRTIEAWLPRLSTSVPTAVIRRRSGSGGARTAGSGAPSWRRCARTRRLSASRRG